MKNFFIIFLNALLSIICSIIATKILDIYFPKKEQSLLLLMISIILTFTIMFVLALIAPNIQSQNTNHDTGINKFKNAFLYILIGILLGSGAFYLYKTYEPSLGRWALQSLSKDSTPLLPSSTIQIKANTPKPTTQSIPTKKSSQAQPQTASKTVSKQNNTVKNTLKPVKNTAKTPVPVKIKSSPTPPKQSRSTWTTGRNYKTGDVTLYNGVYYICQYDHYANANSETPDESPLWAIKQ